MTGNLNATLGQAEIRPAYRPDIDGLRAVAILSVVLYHISETLLPGGFIGVDVFFVISGFLISSLIFKEMDQGGFRFGDFYIRRIRRIFPALILMMATLWIAANFLFTKDEFVQLGQYVFAGGAFISNLLQWRYSGYFDTDAALKPLQHLWSLGIEEQFYIAWPVAVVLLWKRRFVSVVLIAMALSFAFNILRTPHHGTGAFFLPFGRAWELLLGAMLAWYDRYGAARIFYRERKFAGWAMRDLAAALALALLAAGLVLIHSDSAFPGWWVLLPAFAAFLFIWAGETAWLNRAVLAHPMMVFIGLISYPLYIWHWPLLSLLRILSNGEPSLAAKFAAAGIAVMLATLTYLLVERPLRHTRLPRGGITGALATAMAILCLLGGLGYAHVIQTPRMAADAAAEASANRAIDHASSCDAFIDKNSALGPYCRVMGDPTLEKTFVIWGDSHAHAWLTAASTLAKERHAKLVEFMVVACPPLLDVRRVAPHTHLGEACNQMSLADDVLATIKKLKPAEIMVAARWTLYVYGFRNGGMNNQGPLAENTFLTTLPEGDATAETSAVALRTKIPDTLRQLAQIAPVLAIKTVPTLRSSIEVGLRRDPGGYEPTLADYRAFEALPNAILDQAAHDIAGLSLLDPATLLCDAQKCHAILHGVRIYGGDNTHISDAGSLLFMPTLRKLAK